MGIEGKNCRRQKRDMTAKEGVITDRKPVNPTRLPEMGEWAIGVGSQSLQVGNAEKDQQEANFG